MKMFEEMADKIFEEAGVDKKLHENLWEECVMILSTKMAQLSSTMGITPQRIELFNRQKEALVEDLRELQREGEL